MKKIILSLGVLASIGVPASLVACLNKRTPTLNLGSMSDYLSKKNIEEPSSDLIHWSENGYNDRILLVYRNGKYGEISYDAKQGWYGFKYDLPKTAFPEYLGNEDFTSLPFTRKIWRDIAPKADLYISRKRYVRTFLIKAKANYDYDSLSEMASTIKNKIDNISTKPNFPEFDSESLSIINAIANEGKDDHKAIYNKTITDLAKKIANNNIDWFKEKPLKEPIVNISSFLTFNYPDIDLGFTLDLSKKDFIDDLKISKDDIGIAYAGYLIKKYSPTLKTYLLPDSLPFDFTIYLPNDEKLYYKLTYFTDEDWNLVIKAKRVDSVSVITEIFGDYYVF